MYKVVIRPLEISDAEVSWKWRNDEVVWKFTGSKPQNKITLEVELEWIKKVINEENSKRFAILVDDIYVGNIQLTNIQKGETGEYHIFIGNKEYWNKGIAKYATSQIIKYAKNILNLKKLFLYVNPNHLHAIKLYNKCKFVKVSDEVKMELDLSNSITPMVSIFCMVYNHEPFIRDCLDGFLMQKCNFDYEIILGEDCSTDNSRGIILEYANKFPEKFKLLLNDKNIGAAQNQKIVFENCTGKYIAMCEGDDYWIDPLKLQKQVDFLEKNEEYVCCLTESFIGDSRENNKFSKISKNSDISSVNILVESFFATNTFVFRNNTIDISNKIFLEAPLGDTLILYLLSLKGKIKYLTAITGYYRKHIGGVYTGADHFTKIERQIDFYKLLLSYKYLMHEKLINKLINSMYLDLAYNYSYNGKRVEAISSFKKISCFYYFINYKKIIKTIFHLAVK